MHRLDFFIGVPFDRIFRIVYYKKCTSFLLKLTDIIALGSHF